MGSREIEIADLAVLSQFYQNVYLRFRLVKVERNVSGSSFQRFLESIPGLYAFKGSVLKFFIMDYRLNQEVIGLPVHLSGNHLFDLPGLPPYGKG